jgi:hypothetical protein
VHVHVRVVCGMCEWVYTDAKTTEVLAEIVPST